MSEYFETEPGVTPAEIERKFLVATLPDNLESWPRNEIVQGYMAIDANGSEVRLRRKGGRYYETIKSAGGLSRSEFEIELTPDQFQALWPATQGRRVEKTRYDIMQTGGVKIELDVYHGDLSGLRTAEIEFASEADSRAYVVPSWLGQEVTEDSRFKNKNLALHGLPPLG